MTSVLTQRAPLRHPWAGQLMTESVVTPSHVYSGGEADQARESGHREAAAEAGHTQLTRGRLQERLFPPDIEICLE